MLWWCSYIINTTEARWSRQLRYCCSRDKVQIFKIKKNLPKTLQSKLQKFVPQFFAYWHIDHMCQVTWKSQKNCKRSSALKKVWRHRHVNQLYYKLCWKQASSRAIISTKYRVWIEFKLTKMVQLLSDINKVLNYFSNFIVLQQSAEVSLDSSEGCRPHMAHGYQAG